MSAAADPERSYASYRWGRDHYTQFGRLIDIGRVVLLFLFHFWLDRQSWSYGRGPITEGKRATRHQHRAVWIRESLLDLGPTFIKIGQFFSTRADLFPPQYIEELSKLQDQVPAFDYEQVVAISQREFDRSLKDVFAQFDPVPLAAASLGQVHRAQLHSGEEVAVKVQRPGLKRLFSIDLGILGSIAEFVQHRTPLGEGGRDWVGIYEECQRTLWEEVNYLNEGRNANTFRRNFRDVPGIVVPKVYWRYSTPKILTMEYLPGIKVSNFEAIEAAGLERSEIARLGAQSYLRQLLHHGFFHADPHPGNLAVQADGSLIFYDFGMMGRMPSSTKDKLMLNFTGIMQKDANLVVQSMVELGALAPNSDLGPVRRSVQYMLDSYFDESLAKHDEISVAAINDDLYELTYNQPFRFPATFTFVLRSLSGLEALGKSLDPDFNFMDIAYPFAEEIMAEDMTNPSNSIIEQLTRQASSFTNTSLQLPQHLEATLNRLEQGDLKMRVNSVEANRELRQLNTLVRAMIYTILFSVFLLVSTQLFLAGWLRVAAGFASVSFLIACVLGRQLLLKSEKSSS